MILPFTFIEGNSRIAKGSVIGPFARLKDAHLGENVTVTQATVMASSIGAGAVVGPYSHIRPHCHIGAGARIGGFCEIKNTVIGSNSKVPHLSYVGDTDVGSDVNIGAGTITCNYDGAEKHRTIIEDRAFIGSNCNLVAPVVIGSDSYLGADPPSQAMFPQGIGVARNEIYLIGLEMGQKQRRKRNHGNILNTHGGIPNTQRTGSARSAIRHNYKLKIFTGNANPKLAEDIAKYLGTTVGQSRCRFDGRSTSVSKSYAVPMSL